MKKINWIISIFFMGIVCLLINFGGNDRIVVSADSLEPVTLTETLYVGEIAGSDNTNVQFDGKEIMLPTNTEEPCFVIESGCLTIANCHLIGIAEEKYSTIFRVENNGKLIINDVEITNIKADNFIENLEGRVDLDYIVFPEFTNENPTIKYAIRNYSTWDDAIILRNVTIPAIRLTYGCITVVEDTNITGTTSVKLDNFYLNKVVVKGNKNNNIFASRYIDNFVYEQNKSKTEDDGYDFDYIGDGVSEEMFTPVGNESIIEYQIIEDGDIVFTRHLNDISELDPSVTSQELIDNTCYTGQTFHSAKYCTSNKFLNSNQYLYRNDTDKSTLNNYSANIETTKRYSKISGTGIVNLSVKRLVGATLESGTQEYSFVAGNSFALFVDIPQGYIFDSAKFYVNGQETKDILSVDKTKIRSNNQYFRSIIDYVADSYNAVDVDAQFIFKEIPKIANINVINDNPEKIDVSYNSNMIVGNNYDFSIDKGANKVRILSVKFNGVTQTLTNNTFNAVVSQNNTIEIDSVDLPITIVVSPNPEKRQFQFEEEIELQERYYVEEYDEYIDIVYQAEDYTTIGEYNILSATTTNPDYIIELEAGSHTYEVVKKKISISEIVVQDRVIEYYDNFEVLASMFIVEMPDYFNAQCELGDDFDLGLNQKITIKFMPKSSLNYEIIDNNPTKKVNLQITPKHIDNSLVSFTSNTSREYNTEVYTPVLSSISGSNYIDTTFKYYEIVDGQENTVSEIRNSGNYRVEAIFTPISNFYNISKTTISMNVEITAINLNIDNFVNSLRDLEFNYNGAKNYVVIDQSLLPSEIDTCTYTTTNNNLLEFVNAGEYTIEVILGFDSDIDKKNYICPGTLEFNVVVNPIKVVVSLRKAEFEYTGSVPSLEDYIQISGLLNDDESTAVLETYNGSNYGSHTVKVIGVTNSNYYVEDNATISYAIVKTQVDMSNLSFVDITDITYDGQQHMPTLSGVLPIGITYRYVVRDNLDCISAGTYYVDCVFECNNDNYATPATLTAKVEIKKKELTVSFEQPSNMIADGEEKRIDVNISGFVGNETLTPIITYSSVPKNPGNYTCSVSLPQSANYFIKDNCIYQFKIFSPTASFNSEEINFYLDGKFSYDTEVVVDIIDNDLYVINALAGRDIKSYKGININYNNYSTEPVTVNVDMKDITNDVRYLKIYKLIGNELVEVEYTHKNNCVSFELSSNNSVIFVNEKNFVESNIVAIIIVFSLCAVALVIITILTIIHSRKIKKSRKISYIIDNQSN